MPSGVFKRKHIAKWKLEYFCSECGSKIGWASALYGSGKCRVCSQKGHKQNPETKEKMRIGREKYYLEHKKRVKLVCKQCGKEFELTPFVAKKRKFCSKECSKLYMSIPENNPNFGNKWTEEQKIKQGAITKEHMTEEVINKLKGPRPNISGENNPMFGVHRYGSESPGWRGGLSEQGYIAFTPKLKEQIRERDDYTCQLCGIHQFQLKGWQKKLSVHHINYNKKNSIEENLISLCTNCHLKTNGNRNHYKIYFKELLNGKLV